MPHLYQRSVARHVLVLKSVSSLPHRYFLDESTGRRYACGPRNVVSSHQYPGVPPLPPSARHVPGDRFAPHERDGSSQHDSRVLSFAQYAPLSPEPMVKPQLQARNEGTRISRAVGTDITPHRYAQECRPSREITCGTAPTVKTHIDAEVTPLVDSEYVLVRTHAFSEEARNFLRPLLRRRLGRRLGRLLGRQRDQPLGEYTEVVASKGNGRNDFVVFSLFDLTHYLQSQLHPVSRPAPHPLQVLEWRGFNRHMHSSVF